MTTRPLISLVVVATLALVACGGDEAADEPDDTATTETTTETPTTQTSDSATTDAPDGAIDGPVSTVLVPADRDVPDRADRAGRARSP